jgi:hypothetical protein
MRELVESKKFLFFGGKGGVGKTTMAAATATWLADQGFNTLIVATDPTISLSAIYEQEISETEVTCIGKEKNLCGLNINPKKAMGVFQSRMNNMMEGFSPCSAPSCCPPPARRRSPLSINSFLTWGTPPTIKWSSTPPPLAILSGS